MQYIAVRVELRPTLTPISAPSAGHIGVQPDPAVQVCTNTHTHLDFDTDRARMVSRSAVAPCRYTPM